MTNKSKPVLFIDLDNTIIEGPFENAIFPEVFDELSRKSGLEISEIRKIIVAENFSRQDNPNISANLAMDWDDIVQTVAKKLNVKMPESIVLNLLKGHLHAPYIKLLDNAFETLSNLNSGERNLVAATKGLSKYQMPVIEALGIMSVFSEILTPDKHNVLKKDIRFYSGWINHSTIQIIVGDNLMDDVVYPKSFGFKSIWRLMDDSVFRKEKNPFERPSQYNFPENISVKPDAIIYNLKELLNVVKTLEG